MPTPQLVLTLLAVLLPVLLVELPQVGQLATRVMPPISGTYDVLLLVAALPKEQVEALIPKSAFIAPGSGGGAGGDVLLPIPDAYWRVLTSTRGDEASDQQEQHADQHLVLLQLGYQSKTGPGPSWMPKMSFGECKLEVPFVRHPAASKTGIGVPFVYKQHMLMDNSIIRTSSSVLGLTSASAQFKPSKAPTVFAADDVEIHYKASPSFFEAQAKQLAAPLAPDVHEASWHFYKELIEGWWFGARTGGTVQRFDFNIAAAKIQPRPYEVTVDIHLRSFAPAKDEAWNSAIDLPSGATTLRGLGWRVASPITSRSELARNVAPK